MFFLIIESLKLLKTKFTLNKICENLYTVYFKSMLKYVIVSVFSSIFRANEFIYVLSIGYN